MPTLLQQITTHTDFSGISLSPSAIIKPNPEPFYEPLAAIGPGDNSSAHTGLNLPMTAAYQYNVNYWSVIQCGNNKASLWLNGYGRHLPKDSPGQSLSGYHLAIGGGRVATLPKAWDTPNKYLQFNHVQTLGTCYHTSSAFTQHYVSFFIYCPASGSLPAKSINVIVPTWASRDNGWYGQEYVSQDTNYNGVGIFIQAPLRSTSRYITPWSGSITFGTAGQWLPHLIGFNVTRQNMQNMVTDYCAAANLPLGYYDNPSNWRFSGSSQQVEIMWPNEDRPAGGGVIPGQCGMKFDSIEVNIFAG